MNPAGGGLFAEGESAPALLARKGEPPMTVCDGYFIGGEVIRNKRAPQWGVAPIEDAHCANG